MFTPESFIEPQSKVCSLDVHVAGLGAEQDRPEDEVHARAADGQEGELGAGDADAADRCAREVREAADPELEIGLDEEDGQAELAEHVERDGVRASW